MCDCVTWVGVLLGEWHKCLPLLTLTSTQSQQLSSTASRLPDSFKLLSTTEPLIKNNACLMYSYLHQCMKPKKDEKEWRNRYLNDSCPPFPPAHQFKRWEHGLINYIDTKAKCRHLKYGPVQELRGRCLSEFIDWRYSQSCWYFPIQLCKLLPL